MNMLRIHIICLFLLAMITACQGGVANPSSHLVYYVQEGDSIESIAQKYEIPPEAILIVNDIKDPGSIAEGQPLHIPENKAEDDPKTPSQAQTPTPMPSEVTRQVEAENPTFETPSFLMSQHRYDGARQELNRQLRQDSADSEAYYQMIQSFVLEVKWAMTLEPEKRTEIITKMMYWQDYLGLICQLSESYIVFFGPTDTHFETMSELNQIAISSLHGAPCEQQAMDEFDAEVFAERLAPFADFSDQVDTVTFE